jgi:cytochrome oxidase Cu insertion factor (SCO1/SenC/PrrC family)
MRSYEDTSKTPRPLFANIGTPYDVDSIHFKLIETGEFTLFRQPYKYDSGRLIWPAKKDKISKLRHTWDDRQFAIAMELNPKGDDNSVLSAAEIMTLGHETEAKLQKETATFVSLDPASGSRKRRADYAGLAVVRIEWTQGEPLPKVEVLEAFKIRDEAIYQVQEAAALARRYNCPVVAEVNAMQKVYKGLFQHFAGDVRVIQHYTTAKNKQDNQMGLTVLKTLLRNGRFKMLSPDGQTRQTEGMKALVRELRDLGTGAHDHICCAVWFSVWYMFQRVRNRNLPKVVSTRRPMISPYAGFGSSRLTTTIDLRRFRTG